MRTVNAWDRTRLQYIDDRRREVIADGVDPREVGADQRETWGREWDLAVNEIPGDANVPARVLRTMHPALQARVYRLTRR